MRGSFYSQSRPNKFSIFIRVHYVLADKIIHQYVYQSLNFWPNHLQSIYISRYIINSIAAPW